MALVLTHFRLNCLLWLGKIFGSVFVLGGGIRDYIFGNTFIGGLFLDIFLLYDLRFCICVKRTPDSSPFNGRCFSVRCTFRFLILYIIFLFCTHTHTNINTHTHTHTQIYIYIYIYIYVCTYLCALIEIRGDLPSS